MSKNFKEFLEFLTNLKEFPKFILLKNEGMPRNFKEC